MKGFELILPFLKPIEHLILDDAITEVMVNGSERVFVEKNGFLEEVRGLPLAEKTLMIAVKNIARRLGDDISEAKPILDSRLPDGSRFAAVIPPCSVTGVTLTIRKFSSRDFTANHLIEAGTLERWLVNLLEDYVLRRATIVISGGIGTGKTTLLNILGKFIPEDDRIVVIDDSSEIRIAHKNLVRLEGRRAQNGLPEVTIRELLRAALWHHPDWIILGEVRGQETYECWTRGSPAAYLPCMRRHQSKRWSAWRTVFFRVRSTYLTERSKRASVIALMSSSNSISVRGGGLFLRSWKSKALMRRRTNSI